MLVPYSSHCNKRYVGAHMQATIVNWHIQAIKRFVGDTYSSHCNKGYVGDIFKPL